MGEAKGLLIHGLTVMAEDSEWWAAEDGSPDSVMRDAVYLPADMVDLLVRNNVLTAGMFAEGRGLKVSPGRDDVPIRWRHLFYKDK